MYAIRSYYASLEEAMPIVYKELYETQDKLEKYFRAMQDLDVITSYSIHYTKLYEREK